MIIWARRDRPCDRKVMIMIWTRGDRPLKFCLIMIVRGDRPHIHVEFVPIGI